MDRVHTIDDPTSAGGAEIIDHLNGHIRRWEQTLRRIDPEELYISLRDRHLAREDSSDHFIVFDEYEGVRRLKVIVLAETVQSETLLVNAPREVRVEALKRLPKAFEGLMIRRKHGTG